MSKNHDESKPKPCWHDASGVPHALETSGGLVFGRGASETRNSGVWMTEEGARCLSWDTNNRRRKVERKTGGGRAPSVGIRTSHWDPFEFGIPLSETNDEWSVWGPHSQDVEKDWAESLKSNKEREKTLGNQAALGLLSISAMRKEKSMLEEIVEHSFWDRAESFRPEGRGQASRILRHYWC